MSKPLDVFKATLIVMRVTTLPIPLCIEAPDSVNSLERALRNMLMYPRSADFKGHALDLVSSRITWKREQDG